MLVVCDPDGTELLDIDVIGRVVYTLLVLCEDTDDPISVVVYPAVVLEVTVPWLVLVRGDEVDPGGVLLRVPLLPYVDEDKPGALVECCPLVVSPVFVRTVLVAVPDVAWEVGVV